MPHGRHRWRGASPGEVCPRRIYGFLEPCLLLLLHCKEVHGYELSDGLKRFGFERDPVDLSTIYRILRALEDRGLVVSHWETSGAGPPRRLYQITAEGDRYLAGWVQDLKATDEVLHDFLDTYNLHMEVHR